MLVARFYASLLLCVAVALQVLVGRHEQPRLLALEGWPSARNVVALLLCLDLLAALALRRRAGAAEHRRPSLRTRTLLWFRAKLWALKGSRIRGFRQRRPRSPAAGPLKAADHDAAEALDRLEVASTEAGSITGSPASAWSRQTSPALSRQLSPLHLPDVSEDALLEADLK